MKSRNVSRLLGTAGATAAVFAVSAWHLSALRASSSTPMGARLVTGKAITPVGRHTDVGSVPLNVAVSPNGRFVAVTSNGFRQQLSLIETATGRMKTTVEMQEYSAAPPKPGVFRVTDSLYYGLAFSPDGTTLYASCGGADEIATFRVNGGRLLQTGHINNPRPQGSPVPNFISGLATNGAGTRLYAANLQTDSLSVIDTRTRTVLGRVPVGAFPLAVAALSSGDKVYVSSQRDGTVSVVSPAQGRVLRTINVGSHPASLLFDGPQRRLYVANAHSDTISIIDTASDRVIETILLRPALALNIPGATPSGLSLSPDGRRLYVALSEMNAVAVVALNTPNSEVMGYLPTGWYPTAVATATDGERIFVANAKGTQAMVANPQGPNNADDSAQYVYQLYEGTLQTIDLPSERELERLSGQVLANNNLGQEPSDGGITQERIPIKHVIYIVKENRTYDQVLGDMPQGNGDPSLTIFGRDVTPNQHKLAEQFVLLDNFYCSGEVSGVGWNWSTSATANQYVEKTNPYNYSQDGQRRTGLYYDYEGQNRGVNTGKTGTPNVAEAPGGYIWDLVRAKGLTYRNYGFFLAFAGGAEDNQPTKAALIDHTNLDFRRYDMRVSDMSRFEVWKKEFDQMVAENRVPNFMMVRFPRDHTQGTAAGYETPRAMVADNDMAVGKLVETLSKSPIWKESAVFVIQDDAQDGPDHVSAHRSIAFVASPYVRRGSVDHTFYTTCSMLRTMELLLGLPPMNQNDATATPMASFWAETPDLTPFETEQPKQSLTEKNTVLAFGARESAKMAFAREDQAPWDRLNRILWHSVKGPNVPMPEPKRMRLPLVMTKR